MSVDVQQLQSDFEQVRQLLELYPNITLLQTHGDPPDRYDIEYNVKGYKAHPDGTASPANKHAVRITLPLGYPHLAPTVKPLSPVFHPDIDPDAVRIADFWEKSRSLTELIIHIGQMICGAVYSADEPFNQRAFDWYEARKSWLPFDILAPGEKGADEAEAADEVFTAGDEILSSDINPDDDGRPQTDQGNGVQFPVEQHGDDFTLELELESRREEESGADQEIDDWTTFQESGNFPAGDEGESFGEGTEPYDLPGDSANAIEDIFDLEVEPVADQTEAGETDSPAASGERDLIATLSAEREAPERSAGSEAKDQPDLVDEINALELAADQSQPPAGKGRSVGQKETMGEEKDGLGEFSLELDEDPTRRYGGAARSIQPLIEQKEIFTAKKVLADLADPDTVPAIEDYRQTIAAAISEADELYKKADKHEQKGELEKAGIILDLVANIAIDYPGLELARNRIRESMMAQGQKKPPPPPAEKRESDVQDREPKTTEEYAPTRKIRRRIRVKLPYKLITVVLVLAGCAIGGAMIFKNDSNNIRLAQREFENGRQQVQKRDFMAAQRAFDGARTALTNILLVHRGTKHELQAQIDSIVTSAAYREGLQGRVLYDGRYVSIEAAKAIDQFKQHTDAAEKYQQAGHLDLAVESFEKSLLYAEPAGFKEREQDIRQAMDALRLRQTLALAGEAEEAGEWDQAAVIYEKALQLDRAFSSPEERQQIAFHLVAASFRHELAKSKRAYTASDWQESIDSLERAENILAENPTIADDGEKTEMRRMLVNSRLFHLLSVARMAYEQQQWDRAVTEYTNAVAFLDENAAVLGNDEVADGRKQIARTILMTRIAQEQNRLDAALLNNDLEEALEQYRTIARLIGESPFKDDEILRKIHENADSRSLAVDKELLINRRIDWLMQNFDRIFREHYPSAKQSELLHPDVSFIKREGNIMIFAMSCTEKQQGRAFRLELNYQYDMDTDTWKIYSGKL